jgi:protein-tyrosine phosphatase
MDRILNWDGCNNVRDLGGLRTRSGSQTRWGAVVRSDNPCKLSRAGWASLYGHGIRTIIPLRTDGQPEDEPDIVPRPTDIVTANFSVSAFNKALHGHPYGV